MDASQPTVPSSFIPHDTAESSRARRASTAGLTDLLLLFSIVILIASAALGIGVFLYQQYLVTSEKSKIDQLDHAKKQFDPVFVQNVMRLDDRMRSAEKILAAHIAPTALFQALQQTTLTTIAFRSLDFAIDSNQHPTIKMSGVAQSVNSIALQEDLFSKGTVVNSPIFSGIDRQLDGVHFNLNAVVNAQAINYTQIVNGQNASPALPTVPAQNTVVGPSSTPPPPPPGAASSGNSTP